MQGSEILQNVNYARDAFGILSPDTIGDSLINRFTPEDWKLAATLFSKGDGKGFYIDDKNGQLTIHNDFSLAHEVANKSVLDEVAKSTGKALEWGTGITLSFGALSGFGAYMSGAFLAGVGSALAGGALFSLTTIAFFEVSLLVAGAVQKLQAREEVRHEQQWQNRTAFNVKFI